MACRRCLPPVRLAHGKAAEYQARGAVHFHVLLRMDGIDLADPAVITAPPAGLTAPPSRWPASAAGARSY